MLKGKIPLLVALILGVLAAVLIWYQLNLWKKEAQAGWQLETVIVAKSDLEAGTYLSEDDLDYQKMPAKFKYPSLLVPNDAQLAVGREVLVPVKAGEPLHWYQLRGLREQQQLSRALRNGWRAVSIDVSERSAVGNWVRPNDQVDVLGTFRDINSNQMVSVTLLQNVIILATGQTSRATQGSKPNRGYGTVTLMVLPEEAEVILLAQEQGQLYLSLRKPGDPSVFEERARTTINTLLTGERINKIQKVRNKKIQIIRGLSLPKLPRR